ncbi:outer membrane beta-barrel protein [Autumnicola musiva]|uniref:Outer membrane beta-barrel protein n=1 Tax=Autumnicola musiva TaxID=3075589 RepID=A0ABU3DB45_9FLAO|nr:outer membrane beta-barrel protein [Zunongwangia sp. F117]MDT0678589.1 outer membrane beta-barrel protein [Zunongwangia sp. F117]
MKKLMLLAIAFCGITVMAQESSFGIKGGLNYGATGDYENFSQVVEDAPEIEEGEQNTGYHLGFYGKIGIAGIFIQPELLYTRLTTEYSSFDYVMQKIDAPIMVGINVLGPLNIKAGPSFQYVLSNKLEGTDLEIGDVAEEITVGYQLGVGLNLGRLGIDARYEGAFQDNDAFGEDLATDNGFKIDSRPSQWILSASYAF